MNPFSAREIRDNREKMRTNLKIKIAADPKLIAKNNPSAQYLPDRPKEEKEEPAVAFRTRRKTSLDIRQLNQDFDMFECCEIFANKGFQSLYEIVRKLDEGTESVVYLCKEIETGKDYAVKVVRQKEPEMVKQIKKQFIVMRNLSHDHILKAYNLFINEKTGVTHLVLEYCEYDNLRVYLEKQPISSENETAQILNSLFKVVAYLHSIGVCHRDIKPENILYDPKTGDMKLIDFGISKMVKYEHQQLEMWTITGTLPYKAPEMFKGCYSQQVDIWAIGVICYELLTGIFPFYNKFTNETIRQILEDEPRYDLPNLTDCCLNFMKGCLHKDPLKRMNAREALKSPYMLKYTSISSASSPKHKRNGSEGHRRGSFEFEMNKCLNEDSELSNRNSLMPDGGIRVVIDFSPDNEESQP